MLRNSGMAAQSSQPTLGRKTDGKKEKEKHVFAKKGRGEKRKCVL
jgi:hypothetical protein